MGFSGNQNPNVGLDSGRKRKRRHGLSVTVTLRLWSEKSEANEAIKAPAMGSKKGCMKGKEGPQNQRQRFLGKSMAEIRARTEVKGFDTAFGAARAIYGEKPIKNMSHVSGSDSVATASMAACAGTDDSMTGSNSSGDLNNGCNLALQPLFYGFDSLSTSSVLQAFSKATTTTATCVGSDSKTSVSSNSRICAKNVGFEGETTGMNLEFPTDSEPPLTTGRMKAEAEMNKEAKPGDGESMKVTDNSWLDGFDFFDDIPMDFGAFYDEFEFFNVDEFFG